MIWYTLMSQEIDLSREFVHHFDATKTASLPVNRIGTKNSFKSYEKLQVMRLLSRSIGS